MNIQPNVENALRDIVVHNLTTRTPFTSVDIVKEVRNEGYFLKHADGAEWLRRNVIQLSYEYSALYNQTLIEVNSERDGLTRAYLYHHMDDQPDSYQSRGAQPAVNPLFDAMARMATSVYQHHITPASTGGHHHSNYQKRDAYGRFC